MRNLITTLLSSALDDVRSHRGGDLNLVVPTGIGRPEFVQEVDYAEVHQALSVAKLLYEKDGNVGHSI